MIHFTVEDEHPDITRWLAGKYPLAGMDWEEPNPRRTNLRAHLIAKGLLKPRGVLKMDQAAVDAAFAELEDFRLYGAYEDRGVAIWAGRAVFPKQYDDE